MDKKCPTLDLVSCIALSHSQTRSQKKNAAVRRKKSTEQKAQFCPFSSLCRITLDLDPEPKAAWQSFPDSPILDNPIFAFPGCPFLSFLPRLSCFNCSLLAVLSWHSYVGSPVLLALFWPSRSSFLVLAVLFCCECPFGCPLVSVQLTAFLC